MTTFGERYRRPYISDASVADAILNSSVIAGRTINQEQRRHGRITAVVGPRGELITEDSQTKSMKRTPATNGAILYTRPTRCHWWQFWRPSL